jgi:hypothetical protein
MRLLRAAEPCQVLRMMLLSVIPPSTVAKAVISRASVHVGATALAT